MAGLMGQVPAWKLIAIDPLPIIRSLEEEDLDVEGDSLASMVDEASDEASDEPHDTHPSSVTGLVETSDGKNGGPASVPQGSW